MISPTVGRIVWFYPGAADTCEKKNEQPCAAVVAFVHDDRKVNLAVFNHHGGYSSRQDVQLLQDDDAVPAESHATWMPYQVGQAKKDSEAPKS